MASIYRVGHNWRAQVRLAGRPSVSQVFPTKAEAIRWARSEEAKTESDLDGGKRPYTLATAIEGYRDTLGHIGTSKASVLNILSNNLGTMRLAELTSKVIVQYAKDRLSGKATAQGSVQYAKRKGRPPANKVAGPATVLQDLVYLGTVLRHSSVVLNSKDAAVAAAHCSAAITTLRHGRMVMESERRERRPTEDELIRLEQFFDNRPRSQVPMSDIMHFAICTAMRLGEIVELRWEDYNPEDRTIWVRGRKDPSKSSGRDDRIPLISGHVAINRVPICPIEIMARQKTAKKKTGRIFPYAGQTITLSFSQAVDKLGISDLHFHDLRHEGISRLFEAGFQIPQVALVSGHKSWRNLQRYTNLAPESLHNYLNITTT